MNVFIVYLKVWLDVKKQIWCLIVLGHQVLKRGLAVDRVKIEIAEKLPPLVSERAVFQ